MVAYYRVCTHYPAARTHDPEHRPVLAALAECERPGRQVNLALAHNDEPHARMVPTQQLTTGSVCQHGPGRVHLDRRRQAGLWTADEPRPPTPTYWALRPRSRSEHARAPARE